MNGLSKYWVIGSTALISLAMIFVSFNMYGISEASLRLTLRETARLSLILFLLAYIASSLHQVLRNDLSRWLMRHRRDIGIAFGVSHLIHLMLIFTLMANDAVSSPLEITDASSLIVGIIGYVLIIMMLITSNDFSVRRLGRKKWKRLHTTGMHYVFITFLVSYLSLLEKDLMLNSIPVALLCMSLAIRLMSLLIVKKKITTQKKRAVV